MPGPNRSHVADVRGASRVLVDATAGVVGVVERMHRTIQRVPGPLGRPVAEPTRGLTGLVYRSVRAGVDLVGRGLDASLGALEGRLPPGDAAPSRDAFVAVLNGVYGDYLARTRNPLAIAMQLRHEGAAVDPSNPAASCGAALPSRRLLVFVHGLCMTDGQRSATGAATARNSPPRWARRRCTCATTRAAGSRTTAARSPTCSSASSRSGRCRSRT